ncbi:MAG: hypothetical protein ACLUD2_20730 [Clostridium sp.]
MMWEIQRQKGTADLSGTGTGEFWIIPNLWISGESSPQDPSEGEMTWGQADMLRRVIPEPISWKKPVFRQDIRGRFRRQSG